MAIIARLVLLTCLLFPVAASAKCFLFFCSHPRYHHIHHYRHHYVRKITIVKKKVVIINHVKPLVW